MSRCNFFYFSTMTFYLHKILIASLSYLLQLNWKPKFNWVKRISDEYAFRFLKEYWFSFPCMDGHLVFNHQRHRLRLLLSSDCWKFSCVSFKKFCSLICYCPLFFFTPLLPNSLPHTILSSLLLAATQTIEIVLVILFGCDSCLDIHCKC